jgi:DNA polymerase-3 subunit delta
MTFAEFQQAIADGAVPHVLLFHGEEPFLARLGVRLLKKRLLAPGAEAFDFSSLSGRETDVGAIATHAATAPMLSEGRLTVVYEFERLSPSQRTKLLEYIAAPAQTGCLALVSLQRLAGKNKFERQVLASTAVVDCGRPPSGLLADVVRRMAGERGKQIEEGALSLLVQWTDGQLTRIGNEIDKLVSFVQDRESISTADVEAVVGAKASSLMDLTAAIAGRDTGSALALVDELMEHGMDAAQVVSQLYGAWMSLWRSRVGRRGAGRAEGRSRPPRAQPSGAKPSMREMAVARTSREYARGVEHFYRADVGIRRGMPPEATVRLLVYDLASGN